ncbi:MAG: bifunctional hydroxymethylpyrimidine kinase/phosphomethylpyrimidine kinase [Anaerolineaceae bacterium]|nr:bifunctional hydroxymethylpyrimidine kinase/phosphomethylpyrimidine kinase [Anaerolineaceae bacterium]
MKTYRRLLTIAGSDSGGGAGIQADLKTFAALGGYGMSVIAALTAQNTQAVRGIHAVPADFVALQIQAVLEDIGVDAVKIGMLHSPEVIRAVAAELRRFQPANIVLDPVMVAKSGDKLLQDEAIQALKDELLPLATVITPNLPEAAVLLGRPVEPGADLSQVCAALLAFGPQAVLVKGGHLDGADSPDTLLLRGERQARVFTGQRIQTRNTHGTGCTLSSAIAAYLAQGISIPEAVEQAKAYLSAALEAGKHYRLGNGHGPVQHFYSFWE